MEVSLPTTLVRAERGLEQLSIQALGQCFSMAPASSRKTGTLRRDLDRPPGPTVSPTVWKMPYFSGTSRSTCMASRPPVEMVTTTKSAPSRASSLRVVRAKMVRDPTCSP